MARGSPVAGQRGCKRDDALSGFYCRGVPCDAAQLRAGALRHTYVCSAAPPPSPSAPHRPLPSPSHCRLPCPCSTLPGSASWRSSLAGPCSTSPPTGRPCGALCVASSSTSTASSSSSGRPPRQQRAGSSSRAPPALLPHLAPQRSRAARRCRARHGSSPGAGARRQALKGTSQMTRMTWSHNAPASACGLRAFTSLWCCGSHASWSWYWSQPQRGRPCALAHRCRLASHTPSPRLLGGPQRAPAPSPRSIAWTRLAPSCLGPPPRLHVCAPPPHTTPHHTTHPPHTHSLLQPTSRPCHLSTRCFCVSPPRATCLDP